MRKIVTPGYPTTLVEGFDPRTGSDIKWVNLPKQDGSNVVQADVDTWPELYYKDEDGLFYRRALEGPINVLWFGAKGDGITNDTVAIQKAINCALTLPNKNLLFPPRVYMATSLNISPGLGLIGYGATIMQMAMQPNGTRLATTQNTQHNSDIDSDILSITGLTFDGNSQNQGDYQEYQKEQSMMIFLNANPAKKGRLRVVLTDVTCKNGVSDGISVYKNVNVQINNHVAIDVFRGSPTITGGWSIVQVNNLMTSGATDPTGIDIEPDGAGFGGSLATEVTMNNAQLLDGDFDVGILNGGYFIGNNIVSSKPVFNLACYGTGFVKIMNSSFVIGKKSDLANKIQHASNITFENVKFHLTREFESDATPGEFAAVHYLPNNETNAKLRFINCQLTTDPTLLAGDTVYGIYHRADNNSANGSVYVQGGSMDSGFDYGYYMIQGGTVTIKDTRIDAPISVFVNRTSSYEYNVTLDNPALNGTTPLQINNSAAGSLISVVGLKIDEAKNIIGTAGGITSNAYLGGRTIFGTTTPIGRSVPGIINDRFKLYSPASGQTNEWVCTASSHTAATWIPVDGDIRQGGNTFGTAMSIGTKDNNQINFLINNVAVGKIGTDGALTIGNGNGTTVPSGAFIILNRKTVLALDQNEHAFVDVAIFEKTVAAKAYASYDARTIIQGSVAYDHYATFQSLPEYKGSGIMTNLYGAFIAGVISAGNVTNRYGIIINDITGAGTLDNNYGIFVNTLTKGTKNYSIYTGSAQTRLGGDLVLHNIATAVGTGSLIDFRAGSGADGTGIVLAQILSELIGSTTQANLHFKVRTGAGTPPTGMTEILTLLGGSSYGVGINKTAPAARLHVDGSTRFDLGSDATGDIFYRSSGGNLARLALGSALQVLRVNAAGTGHEYATPGMFPISVFTAAAVSINSTDWGVVMNNTANATVTLPAASSVSKRTFWIKKGLPNAFTVTITGAEQGTDVVLTSENDSILVQSDGAQYYVIARKQAPPVQNVQLLKDFYTDQGNTSTTPNVYTELYGYTMPANTLTANGQKIVCRYSGTFAANANDKGLQVFVGSSGIGTNVWVGGGVAYWEVQVMIIRTGTTTARASVSFLEGGYCIQSDITGLDFTNTIDIDIWGTSGAGAVNDVVAKLGSIEWKAAAP